MKKLDVLRLIRGGVIAAVYTALTLLLAPISYGPFQLRVSEALCVLPLLLPEAVPALYVGCFLANLLGPGLGVADVIFGSLFTLIAAFLTWKMRRGPVWLALLPPVVINAAGVGAMLHLLAQAPLFATAGWIGLGQIGAVYLIGLPLHFFIKKRLAGKAWSGIGSI